jgi:site-specific recombinase XerD
MQRHAPYAPAISGAASDRPVGFALRWEHGHLVEVQTSSPAVAHFLKLCRVRNPYNTWVNYAHDPKVFFTLIPKQPEQVTRADCLAFMALQGEAQLAVATINRRLAAVSSLFDELALLDPTRFPDNPVSPRLHTAASKLYKKNPRRIPIIVPDKELQALYAVLPTWRDRTLLLLQWISCLRIAEAVGIRFADVECSHRRIQIPGDQTKNRTARAVYMDDHTFRALNVYLDTERPAPLTDQEPLFVARRGPNRGQQLSVNAVQKLLQYYTARCGLARLHAHLLRHTGVTQLLEQGMPEPAVRTLVGHKRPESLEPYIHLTNRFVDHEFQQASVALQTVHWLQSSHALTST